MNNIKNLLITGGGGYVGSNTINTLFCRYPNITFIVIDLRKKPVGIDKDILTSPRFIYYQADIGNNKKVMKILKKHHIKHVIDLASFLPWDLLAVSQDEFIANNVISRNNFFNTCVAYGKLEHIVYQASMMSITNSSDIYNASKNVYPKHQYDHILYATTKTAGQSLAYNLQITHRLPLTIVSPMHIYGGKAQHKEDEIQTMTRMLCDTGKITLFRNSNVNYDSWISVFDVIEAYCIIFDKKETGVNYNPINQSQYFTERQTAEMVVRSVTGTTDYDEYITYDERFLTFTPDVKLYGIKSNFTAEEFKTQNTFEENLRRIAKCKC